MTASVKPISAWGIASAVLLIAALAIDSYNGYMAHNHRTPLLSTVTGLRVCAAMQLAAAICGMIAIKRGGSRWWSATVLFAVLLGLGCYFGEL